MLWLPVGSKVVVKLLGAPVPRVQDRESSFVNSN